MYEQGTYVGQNSELSPVEVQNQVSSIIVTLHPWTAKGPEYLSLSRAQKLEILVDKIMEDDTIQEA